jgi:hypothetical protein
VAAVAAAMAAVGGWEVGGGRSLKQPYQVAKAVIHRLIRVVNVRFDTIEHASLICDEQCEILVYTWEHIAYTHSVT